MHTPYTVQCICISVKLMLIVYRIEWIVGEERHTERVA